MSYTPNYSGVFLRGYGSQYSYHYNSILHSSANLGELQGDAIRNITGYFSSDAIPGAWAGGEGGAFYLSGRGESHIKGNHDPSNVYYNFDASRVVPASNENRPINKAVRYLIKAT